MSEIRYDLLRDENVIIAPERLTRPNLFPNKSKNIYDKKVCPFCKGHEDMTPKEIHRIKDKDSWRIRVVPNLYKALQIEATWGFKEDGLYEKSDGFGAHEIIIDTPKHELFFENLEILQINEWLEAIKQRVCDLKKDIRLSYFCIFKNQGQNSGATLPHIHTQLIAMSNMPKNILSLMWHYHNYYKHHGRSVFEDVIKYEKEQQVRIVDENEHFVAFCPYGSLSAFEVILMPKMQISSICDLQRDQYENLSTILKKTLQSLKMQIGEFDYNLYLQNPPFQKNYESEEFFDDMANFFRFYINITPRIYKTGGFELQSGMNINPLLPENAAELLREGVE
jgi:UDPglucose--hexose-1-phosphate uridylyltransferase